MIHSQLVNSMMDWPQGVWALIAAIFPVQHILKKTIRQAPYPQDTRLIPERGEEWQHWKHLVWRIGLCFNCTNSFYSHERNSARLFQGTATKNLCTEVATLLSRNLTPWANGPRSIAVPPAYSCCHCQQQGAQVLCNELLPQPWEQLEWRTGSGFCSSFPWHRT